MSAPAVGIDLGTTNSVVAVSIGGRPQVVRDASGASLIPSMVSFPPSGERLVGRPARVRRPMDPANTISSVKRLLGRPFKSEEVRRAKSRVAFELKEGPDSSVLVATRGGELSLPEVSALVLREVRRIAEEGLGEKIAKCVITVPANFNELQRSSTKIAGRIADLEVIRILNEPTAAALAYGYGRGTREKICIFDFGGGTFDVTLLELSGNVFEVLATAGDTFLGGDDLDLALADWLVGPLLRATRIDAVEDRIAFDILRDAAEQAKIELSSQEVAKVMVAQDLPHVRRRMEFQHTVTREDMERIAAPFVSRTFDVCTEALKLANLRVSDLTAVILVGGSTRIPAVRQRVASFFGREPLTHLAPEEVVGLGAAILAEALTGGTRRQHTQRLIPNRPSGPPGPADVVASQASATPTTPPPAGPRSNPSGELRTTLHGVQSPSSSSVPAAQSSAPNAPPSAPAAAGDRFDLDEPFAPPSAPPSGQRRSASPAQTRESDLTWEPKAPRSTVAFQSLDEPSFMGRMPASSAPGAPPASAPRAPSSPPARAQSPARGSPAATPSRPSPPRGAPASSFLDPFEDRTVSTPAYSPGGRAGAREGSVPSFNLDDPSVMAPNPAALFPDTREHSVPSFNLDDPSIVGPAPKAPAGRGGREHSVPSFSLDDPGILGPTPGGDATREVSIPSFNIDPDEIFGAPPPRAPGGSGPSPNPALPGGSGASPNPAASVERTVAIAAPPPPVERTIVAGPPPSLGGRPAAPPPGAVVPSTPPSRPPPPPSQPPPSLPPAPVRPASAPGGGPAAARGPAPAGPSAGSRSGPMPNPSIAPGRGGSLAAPLLLDVTPFSLGVETAGGLCEVVIRRNATIPVEQTRVFATTYDMQESVLIRIAQGESRRFGDNQYLGELELAGLRAANRGEVTIGVTFELEADGTLKVSARDEETAREQKIRVTLLTLPSETQQAEMAAKLRAGSASVSAG